MINHEKKIFRKLSTSIRKLGHEFFWNNNYVEIKVD